MPSKSPSDHPAIIEWLPTSARGTVTLPHSLSYVGLSRFEWDGPAWPDGAFRVVCQFDVPPSERTTGKSEARVRFLVEDAPHYRLHAGTCFQLYEGLTAVARIEVLW